MSSLLIPFQKVLSSVLEELRKRSDSRRRRRKTMNFFFDQYSRRQVELQSIERSRKRD